MAREQDMCSPVIGSFDETPTCEGAGDVQSECRCLRQPADPVFRRDLPRRHRADKDLVFGINDGGLCIGGK